MIENTEGETGIVQWHHCRQQLHQIARTAARSATTPGGSGKLAFVKSGTGTLTLTGSNCGQYTGGLTVNAGTLDYSSGALPNCNYTISGGTLNIGNRTKSIGTFQITGGTVTGTGSLTSNADYDVQAGAVDVVSGRLRNRLVEDNGRNRNTQPQQHLHRNDDDFRRHVTTGHRRDDRIRGRQHSHQPRRHLGRQPR